jgi:hypothetical protein
MNRLSFVVAVVALTACTNNPPVTPNDAGSTNDAFTPVDAAAVDAPELCTGGCPAGTMCCPDALSYACLTPVAGACPMPDLTVDEARASSSARVIWQFFEATDCALVEGCVTSPGWRRLLRFDTFTPNVGTGDFHMGAPSAHPELFEYSACHMHYHFNGYASYTLLDGSGATVAEGHKQAFCLEDFEQYSSTASPTPTYDCSNQGISVGWGDTYGSYLDCQWIDVTDVAPGSYTIRIDINGGAASSTHIIPEISYANNTANATVTIPADDPSVDPTAACTGVVDGYRDCGWTNAGTFDCTPGASVSVGCGGSCGVGNCHGDPIMRICPDSTPCGSHAGLGDADSECGGTAGNDCPGRRFTCPASGHYTVLTAPYAVADTTAMCTPAAGATGL